MGDEAGPHEDEHVVHHHAGAHDARPAHTPAEGDENRGWRRRYWIIDRPGWWTRLGPMRYVVASEDAPMDARSNRLFVHLALGAALIGVVLLALAVVGH